MNRAIFRTCVVAGSLSIVAASPAQTPLGPGFVYQGRLNLNGSPVNGPADFEFSLWADPTSQNPGTWLTGAQVMNAVPVANGLFTVTLNAGGELGGVNNFAAFDGTERWLEIHVRFPAGSGTFATLTPRQRIAPAPHALYAATTDWTGLTGIPPGFADGVDHGGDGHSLDAVDGSPTDALYVNAAGGVGIGTTNPLSLVHVASAGPAILRLEADTDNVNENDIASVFFRQDGGQLTARVGFRNDDHFEVVNAANSELWLGANNGNQLRVTPSGVQMTGTTTAADLDVDGTAVINALAILSFPNWIWQTTANLGLRLSQGTTARAEFNDVGFDGSDVDIAFHLVDNDGGQGSVAMDVYEAGPLGDVGSIYADVLYGAGKFFRIDHPLDPANKYLLHGCIESSEMKNLYDGVATTDSAGYATVSVPDYMEALNTAFRYQLTVIDDGDDFVLAKVTRELQDGSFEIRTSRPSVKVSWQLTGVRRDPFAAALPFEVERPKQGRDRGRYLHPEVYGQPKALKIGMPVSD